MAFLAFGRLSRSEVMPGRSWTASRYASAPAGVVCKNLRVVANGHAHRTILNADTVGTRETASIVDQHSKKER